MIIRKARKDDIPELGLLLKQVLDVHHNVRPDLFKEGATKYTDQELALILDDPDRPIFVAVSESDKAIGYAFCIFLQHRDDNILTDIKTLYIDDLCVDREYRKKGIGKALYNYVSQFAIDSDCYNLTLNVWADNISALAFYESIGLRKQKIGMELILK